MNEQEAKDAFERGRVQPKCPNCNQSILLLGKKVKMTITGTYDTILAAGYQCVACQERFVAHIGAPVDGEQTKS